MNRYPGIQPFERNQSHLFKGREEEKRELLDLITLHPLVVLFAKSGIGKTSLLQAGIAPEMEEEQLLPVFIRLNRTDDAPEKQVRQILQEERYLSQETPDDLSLWEYLKKARFVQAGEPCTPVLIFDQFEELFTLYEPQQREQFVAEFADVVNKRMPDKVREWFDRDFDKLPPRQVALYERPLNVKVVLSIRSDMLSFLDQLSRPIPSILRSRYELESLSRKSAKQAIIEPAKAEGKFVTPSFKYNEDTLNQILNYLQGNPNGSDKVKQIESSQLQLFCRHIEDNYIHGQDIEITESSYGGEKGLREIIDKFYHNIIQKFPADRRDIIQNAIEEGLIDDERRISMDEGRLIKKYQIKSEELKQLEDARLLRKEPRLDSYYYEISHDTLVEPIFKNYQARKEKEEQLKQKQKQIQQQRRIKQLVVLSIFGLLLALMSGTLAWWAFQQREVAKKAEKLSIEKEIEAQESIIKYLDGEINASDKLIKDYTRLNAPKLTEIESIKMKEKEEEKKYVENRINELKQKLNSNE